MEIRVVEKTEDAMQLVIQGVDVPFMNALRRIVLSEVPSMAIDEIVIIENSSVLHDEILAHRLGFIPIKTDLDSYNLPEKCSCKSEFGCSLCRTTLTLEVESDSVEMVHSADMTPEDPDVAPVSGGIPIVKLAPGQKIKLEAYVRLGRGKDHAKWQPVSVCAYKHLPRIDIDESRCDACGKCVGVCPKRVLVKAEKKKIGTRDLIECTLCRDCVHACPLDPPAIEIAWDKDAFVLNMESNGGLPLERIVLEALNILDEKFEDFLSQLTTVK